MPTCGALVQQVLVAMSAPFAVQFMFKLLHGMGCISIPVFACDESGAVRGHAQGHTGGHLWSRGIARPLDFQESLDPFSLDAKPHRFSARLWTSDLLLLCTILQGTPRLGSPLKGGYQLGTHVVG